jgi:hypothetical protein
VGRANGIDSGTFSSRAAREFSDFTELSAIPSKPKRLAANPVRLLGSGSERVVYYNLDRAAHLQVSRAAWSIAAISGIRRNEGYV